MRKMGWQEGDIGDVACCTSSVVPSIVLRINLIALQKRSLGVSVHLWLHLSMNSMSSFIPSSTMSQLSDRFKPPLLPLPVSDTDARMDNAHNMCLREVLRFHLMALVGLAALTTVMKRIQFETEARYCFFVLGLVLGSTTMISIIIAVRLALRRLHIVE